MAGNIKGIIVEIGGDTSGLQNALKKVNSATASLSKELKGINSLLKLDPKNTELLSQKQTVLKQNIEQTTKKLESLKEAQKRYVESGGNLNTPEYRNLQREIINTENKLKNLKVEASNWTQASKTLQGYSSKLKALGDSITKVGQSFTKKVTAPIIGFGTYAVKSFNTVDEGADTVIKKTGAIGDAAKELESVYKKVSSNVVGEFNDIGSAVGEINTRFEFTGDTLQEASEKFMKFAKINDIDVNTAVQKVSRYMGDASIEASNYGEVLDELSAAAQVSGISVDALAEYCTKYGAPMRALGLNTKESIAIFAGWEKAGVNTEIAFSGMKKAISNWGKAGKDSSKEFKKTLEEIKKAPNIAEATSKAIEVFGAKAGPDLADAIQGGRFEYEKFLNVLENSQGTLENTYNGVVDEADDVQIAMKRIKVQASDIGQEILKNIVPSVQKFLDKVQQLFEKFNGLNPETKELIIKIALIAAAIGPMLIIIGKVISVIGSLIGIISTIAAQIGMATAGVGTLSTVLSVLTGPVGIVIAVIGALIAVFKHLWDTNEDFRSKVQEVWKSIQELYTNSIQPLLEKLKQFIVTVIQNIITTIQGMWSFLEPYIEQILTWLLDFWNNYGKSILENIIGVISGIIDIVQGIWSNAIQPTISWLTEKLMPVFTAVFSAIVNTIKIAGNTIGTVVDSITGIFKGIIDFITGVFTGNWEKAWNGIKDIFKNIVSGLGGIIKAPINAIIGIINGFIDGINKVQVPDWVPGVGGKGINIPHIPQLAKGGIVDKATLAMIGEGKSAEAVIPLDRTLTKYLAEALKQVDNSRAVTVNFYPQKMTEAEMDKAFNYINRKFGMAY